jgi:uncharacterized protein
MMTSRNIHRDLGYFYVGLIIAFSISGIFLNHRQSWHPSKYKTEIKPITVVLPTDKSALNDELAVNLAKNNGVDDVIRRSRVNGDHFEASFEHHDLKIELASGKGELTSFIKVPVLSQMTKLHQDTSQWWIYYSDVFGLAMLIIAITGMLMIPQGRLSFKERGWKLALAGLIFPLIFLFLLS